MLNRKKGFSLLMTLVLSSMIMMTASILYTSAREELAITHNIVMHDRAKRAAHSGINHFVALQISQADLMNEMGNRREIVLLENVRLTNRLFYTVKLSLLENNNQSFVVESTGSYEKRGVALSKHRTRAIFRW